MMSDLLSPSAIIPTLRATTRKQAIQELADCAAAETGLEAAAIFGTVLQRERLGSTGVGGGIAIPHGKLPGLDRVVGVFARLERPIEFGAPDGEPVDLLFMLLAPEGAGADHLKALARVARVLRDPALTQKLRTTSDGAALYSVLTEQLPASSNAA
jgi:PTS system nitrogen regulatory IIA component